MLATTPILLATMLAAPPAADEAAPYVSPAVAAGVTRLSMFEGYAGVLIAAFLVTLVATPIMRRLAIANGVIDRPSDPRKVHKIPVAYLGGVAVFLGLMAGIFYSFIATKAPGLIDWHPTAHTNPDTTLHFPVPLSVLLGMTVIVLVGVIDDVASISPRVKIAGQLFAAACLAVDTLGVRLAAGLTVPIAQALGIPTTTVNGLETILLTIPLPFALGNATALNIDIIYWLGTAAIAIAVIGLCNAANLLDGLDGLLGGTTAITSVGLLIIALSMALMDDGPRDAQRIILCMALLGACLGFLPHNFNPATIFLGDAGSLLLGFTVCVIICSMGDTGKTHLVAAGLIAFMLPILDTSLAIVRRKMEGKSISAADDQHLHHMLKRAMGVKGAVLVLYGIAAAFAALAALVSLGRARVVYLIALMLTAYIGVIAIKAARRRFIEQQAQQLLASEATPAPTPAPAPPLSATDSPPAPAPSAPRPQA